MVRGGGIVGSFFKEIGSYYVCALKIEQWLLRKSILIFGTLVHYPGTVHIYHRGCMHSAMTYFLIKQKRKKRKIPCG